MCRYKLNLTSYQKRAILNDSLSSKLGDGWTRFYSVSEDPDEYQDEIVDVETGAEPAKGEEDGV